MGPEWVIVFLWKILISLLFNIQTQSIWMRKENGNENENVKKIK